MKNEVIIAVENVTLKQIKGALPKVTHPDYQKVNYVLGLRLLRSGKYSIVHWEAVITDSRADAPRAWQRKMAREITDSINRGYLKNIYLIGLISV